MPFVIEGGCSPSGRVHQGVGTLWGRSGPVLAHRGPFSGPGANGAFSCFLLTWNRRGQGLWGCQGPADRCVWAARRVNRAGPWMLPLANQTQLGEPHPYPLPWSGGGCPSSWFRPLGGQLDHSEADRWGIVLGAQKQAQTQRHRTRRCPLVAAWPVWNPHPVMSRWVPGGAQRWPFHGLGAGFEGSVALLESVLWLEPRRHPERAPSSATGSAARQQPQSFRPLVPIPCLTPGPCRTPRPVQR